jgi:hypothetical protein
VMIDQFRQTSMNFMAMNRANFDAKKHIESVIPDDNIEKRFSFKDKDKKEISELGDDFIMPL